MAQTEADLQLLGTMACHLCELAEQVVMPLVAAGCQIEAIDIADCDELLARYQTAIPVLRGGSGELHWPFDTAAAQALWEQQRG